MQFFNQDHSSYTFFKIVFEFVLALEQVASINSFDEKMGVMKDSIAMYAKIKKYQKLILQIFKYFWIYIQTFYVTLIFIITR